MTDDQDDVPATKHPQVTITHGERVAEVDEGIAELILELWKADINTAMSCQHNQDRVWIMFPTATDAERFLNTVVVFDDDIDSIYNAVTSVVEPDDWETYRAERAWRFDAEAHDYGTEWPEDDGPVIETGPRDFAIGISVRFPHSDYTTVLARLQAANVDLPATASSTYAKALIELGHRHPDELAAIEAELEGRG